MAVDNIILEFNEGFEGVMKAPNGEVKIGVNQGEISPYNLLFGALGSCFYATFLSVVVKKRLSFERATVEISGNKRTEVPTTLEYVVMTLTVKNPSNEAQVLKSAQLGAEYCSIHETIKQVAQIELIVKFEY